MYLFSCVWPLLFRAPQFWFCLEWTPAGWGKRASRCLRASEFPCGEPEVLVQQWDQIQGQHNQERGFLLLPSLLLPLPCTHCPCVTALYYIPSLCLVC
jgi:hypothetical protein